MEYICIRIGIKKIYGNPLEEIITILWAIWNHRNNIIFRNHKCNPVYVIDIVKKIFHNILYNKSANLNSLENIIRSKVMNAGKFHKVKH